MAKMPKPKNTPGRNRSKAVQIPEFSGMEQMSGATGIPLQILKQAKRDGCMFVNHGRCDLIEFLKWFFNRELGDDENVNWGNRDKRAAALLKEERLRKDKDLVIDFNVAAAFVTYLTGQFFGDLDRLKQEFPATLKAKSEIAIFEEVDRTIEGIKSPMKDKLKSWIDKKGKV